MKTTVLLKGILFTILVWGVVAHPQAAEVRRSVQFSPDGRHLITTSSNHTVQIWDAVTGQPHEVEQNNEMVGRYFEEWANHGNAAVADELIATNLLFHSAGTTIKGRAEYKTRLTAFHAAFPDLRYTVEDKIATRDRVVVRWTLRATQAKEYQGHASNGKNMIVTGISIFHLAGGKIEEIWVSMDRLGQMQQLGWLPETTK